MKNIKGFSLVEIGIVVLIILIMGVLSIQAIHQLYNDARWKEGRLATKAIAEGIRLYHTRVGPTGLPPISLQDIGYNPGDFNGVYFTDDNFDFEVTSMDPYLEFTVTARNSNLKPTIFILDENERK